jgi:CubicO group peptidase (beta-lactamase class C family)
MIKKSLILLLCLLFFLSAAFPNVTPTFTPTIHQLPKNDLLFDGLLSFLISIGHYPSLSACIIKNDSVVWENQYGMSDLEREKPATIDTIYTVASITKTITSTALMQLYDQGLFALDDDVNEYLPFWLRNPAFPDDPISIRMLLSHASSLNPDPVSYHWFNFSSPPPIPGYPDPWLRNYLLPDGLYYTPEIWNTTYHPGERMQYANINFDLAAYLVQLLSGEPYYQYCADHLFKPLSMTHTSFRLPDLPINNTAIPYLYKDGTYEPLPYYQLLHYPVAGLLTTAQDLSHFLIAQMNHGVYNGTRILSNETVELMHSVQPPGNRYYNYRYGLGWMIEEKQLGHRVLIGHTGDIPGVHTRMFMESDEHTGIICLFNSDRSTYQKMFISLLIQNLLFSKASRL